MALIDVCITTIDGSRGDYGVSSSGNYISHCDSSNSIVVVIAVVIVVVREILVLVARNRRLISSKTS